MQTQNKQNKADELNIADLFMFLLSKWPWFLLSVALCLLSAYLTEVTAPLITTVRNYLLKAIELLNRPIM